MGTKLSLSGMEGTLPKAKHSSSAVRVDVRLCVGILWVYGYVHTYVNVCVHILMYIACDQVTTEYWV